MDQQTWHPSFCGRSMFNQVTFTGNYNRLGFTDAGASSGLSRTSREVMTTVCKVLYVFEHKVQYLLICAPFTRTVIVWHIGDILPMICQICCNTATFCIAAIFLKYCYKLAVGYYNPWASLWCLSCSPLGEKIFVKWDKWHWLGTIVCAYRESGYADGIFRWSSIASRMRVQPRINRPNPGHAIKGHRDIPSTYPDSRSSDEACPAYSIRNNSWNLTQISTSFLLPFFHH